MHYAFCRDPADVNVVQVACVVDEGEGEAYARAFISGKIPKNESLEANPVRNPRDYKDTELLEFCVDVLAGRMPKQWPRFSVSLLCRSAAPPVLTKAKYAKGTDFQHDIYDALRNVPPGSLVAYGQLAVMAGREATSARAVTQMSKHQPLHLILPFHRAWPAKIIKDMLKPALRAQLAMSFADPMRFKAEVVKAELDAAGK